MYLCTCACSTSEMCVERKAFPGSRSGEWPPVLVYSFTPVKQQRSCVDVLQYSLLQLYNVLPPPSCHICSCAHVLLYSCTPILLCSWAPVLYSRAPVLGSCAPAPELAPAPLYSCTVLRVLSRRAPRVARRTVRGSSPVRCQSARDAALLVHGSAYYTCNYIAVQYWLSMTNDGL